MVNNGSGVFSKTSFFQIKISATKKAAEGSHSLCKLIPLALEMPASQNE